MTIRTRKFFGTISLARAGGGVVAAGNDGCADAVACQFRLLQAIFYVVAGLGWVLPAMPIISWMSRPDA